LWNYQKTLSISKSTLNSYIDEFEKERKFQIKSIILFLRKSQKKNIGVEKKRYKKFEKNFKKF
jgi:hypothetical protein